MEFFEHAKSLKSKEQGDAFERVVQLHLKSKPKYASELDEVWLLHEVPKNVRDHCLFLRVYQQVFDLSAFVLAVNRIPSLF